MEPFLRTILREIDEGQPLEKLNARELAKLEELLNDPILDPQEYFDHQTRQAVTALKIFFKEYLVSDIQKNSADNNTEWAE